MDVEPLLEKHRPDDLDAGGDAREGLAGGDTGVGLSEDLAHIAVFY